MAEPGNNLYYFGDLDYEGIGIYEKLAETFRERWEILPFVPAYVKMIEKAGGAAALPDTNITGYFFSYFTEGQVTKMNEVLGQGKYIPQEILNISDF